MVDGGFDIQHLLATKFVTLKMTLFLRGKEEVETSSIASFHVERAIEWEKNYRILQGVQLDEL